MPVPRRMSVFQVWQRARPLPLFVEGRKEWGHRTRRHGGSSAPVFPGCVRYDRSADYRVFTSTAVVPSPRVAEIRAGRTGELEPTSTTNQWKQSLVVAAAVQ